MTEKIPVDMQDSVQNETPLTYDRASRMVGELYINSWLRIEGLRDDANEKIKELQQMVLQKVRENNELKGKLKDAEKTE